MASGLVAALGGDDSSNSEARSNPITRFEVKVVDTDKGEPTFRVLAKRANGGGSKYQNLIVYLDTPDTLRALRAALPTIAKALDVVEAQQVKLGVWKAAPPAPATPAAAPAQQAPTKSALSSAFEDLPW